MRKIAMALCLALAFPELSVAQNKDTAFEQFRTARTQEKTEFALRRAEEYARFKAEYYAAFEQYRKLYLRYLEDEEAAVDLMASDDGIRISPVVLAVTPKVVTTAADQKQILRDNIEKIRSMKPEELLPCLSEETDSLERMRDAAAVMTGIVQEMEAAPAKDEAPSAVVATEVVLEPYDEEYFTSLPSVEEAGMAQEADVPGGSDASGTEAAVPETPASDMDTSIPSGKPTDYVRISSPFGTRIHPITRKRHTHRGIDLAAPKMTPIYATADGKVTFSGRNGGYGNFVKINHLNGYKTAYAHMQKIAVKKGAEVHKGDLVGYVGSTGSSTGNHLHYEVYFNDKLVDPATTL